jgi:hypothetical protein
MGGSLNDLVPELRDAARALVDAAGAAGLQPRVTSTVRTSSEQRRLYNRFLAGDGGFPVLPPGFSAHEYGWAFDMVVSPMEALADVGATWLDWGGGWSGGDAVHFELSGASAEASRIGQQQQSDSLGARATAVITTATDFFLGSNVAGLMQLIPGLSENEALKVLSSPYASFQQWLISQVRLPTFR